MSSLYLSSFGLTNVYHKLNLSVFIDVMKAFSPEQQAVCILSCFDCDRVNTVRGARLEKEDKYLPELIESELCVGDLAHTEL